MCLFDPVLESGNAKKKTPAKKENAGTGTAVTNGSHTRRSPLVNASPTQPVHQDRTANYDCGTFCGTLTPRRFCAQAASFEPTTAGRSLP